MYCEKNYDAAQKKYCKIVPKKLRPSCEMLARRCQFDPERIIRVAIVPVIASQMWEHCDLSELFNILSPIEEYNNAFYNKVDWGKKHKTVKS